MVGLGECDVVFGGSTITSSSQTVLDCPIFEVDTRIVGTPTIHIEAQIGLFATSGHLFVEMVQTSSGMHLGHAVMDLRFHEGGNQGQTLFPGSTVTAMMEFLGMDVVVPSGDGVSLIISQTGEDYVPSPVSTQPVTVTLGDASALGLSIVERGCDDLFLPPMQSAYPEC